MKYIVNGLTAFRFIAAFALIPCFMYEWFYLAFILFALAGITDFFDGYLARKYNVTTKLGGVLDHIADKLLVSITFILLAMFWPLWFISVPIILMIARNLYVSGLREFMGTQKMELPVESARISFAKASAFIQQFVSGGFLLTIVIMPYDIFAWATYYLWMLCIIFLWVSLAASIISAGKYTVQFLKKLK